MLYIAEHIARHSRSKTDISINTHKRFSACLISSFFYIFSKLNFSKIEKKMLTLEWFAIEKDWHGGPI